MRTQTEFGNEEQESCRRAYGMYESSSLPFQLRKPTEQRRQLLFIVFPALDGPGVEGLADLAETGRADGSDRFVEGQARGLPFQAAPRDQPAATPSRSATVSS